MESNSVDVPMTATNSLLSLTSMGVGVLQLKRTKWAKKEMVHLPNELLQLIFGRIKDIRHLVSLRLVCTRWCALVNYLCLKKKSLILSDSQSLTTKCENRFFGQVNLSDFVQCRINCTTSNYHRYLNVTANFCESLLATLPNIEQLSICCGSISHIDVARFHNFAVYINSLKSLKQLDLDGRFAALLPSLAPALSQLEHFSFDRSNLERFCNVTELTSDLTSKCVRFYLGYTPLCFSCVVDWQSNLLWLRALTHLRIQISHEAEQVVHFLCERACSLKVFRIDCYNHNHISLTPTLIGQLASLTHLTQLELSNIELHFTSLEQAAFHLKLVALSTILSFKLGIHCFDRTINGDQLTRILCVIFPNSAELTMNIVHQFKAYARLRREIVEHLGRFVHLRNYEIL